MERHFGRTDRFDDLLATLVTEEILVLDRNLWRFRSDLVREVAYQTITKIDRAKRHAGIADYIERKKYPDQLTEPAWASARASSRSHDSMWAAARPRMSVSRSGVGSSPSRPSAWV